MERLQSALERARQRREITGKSARGSGRKAKAAPNTDLHAAWEALSDQRISLVQLERNRVLTQDTSVQKTHFDVLRTKVMQMASQNDWTRVAVTSPNSACGKTTTCLNLAYSIARNSETRVLLIEMDMRRPALARVLGISGSKHQFSHVLEGSAEISEHLVKLQDNLAVGYNRIRVKSPSELLQSGTMRDALDELERTYAPTLMLFDMPPMLVSDDMLGFSKSIDAAILVAAAESTSLEEVDVCERELSERTNVMGVILNKCRYMGKQYEYEYY